MMRQMVTSRMKMMMMMMMKQMVTRRIKRIMLIYLGLRLSCHPPCDTSTKGRRRQTRLL